MQVEEDSKRSSGSLIESLKRLFPGKRRALTEKELQEAINSCEEQGILNEAEGDMLQSIFEFGDTLVREVMVPRMDMVCCSVDSGVRNVLDLILNSGHSRIPIFEGSTDRIVGVVYAKDLLRHWGESLDSLSLDKVMRAPQFIPETKRIDALLIEFRTTRVHIAIAVDEYGGTSGLITIEDLLEEIVGDIQDEYDLEEDWIQLQDDGALLVDARTNVQDLEEYFQVEIAKEKFDTVGGYLFHLLGHVPRVDETVQAGSLTLQVVESDERKVRKVRAWREPAPDPDRSS